VQLIRVGLRKAAADPARETTYRLFLQEVPGALEAGKKTVQMALKISLPVFVQPKEVVRKLDWSAQRLADGRVRLRLSNQGNAHVQLTGLGLYLAGQGKPLASEKNMAYVLAGQVREWLLTPNTPLAPSVSVLRLQSGSDSGRIEQDVPLQAP
jgi:fimbrial chaperone protein